MSEIFPAIGEQKAVFDLAWPNVIQEELSQPVAVLLNESSEMMGIASEAGYLVLHGPGGVPALPEH